MIHYDTRPVGNIDHLTWAKVKVWRNYSDAYRWLANSDLPGMWTYGVVTRPPPHTDHYVFFIQDADAAFAFKMVWG